MLLLLRVMEVRFVLVLVSKSRFKIRRSFYIGRCRARGCLCDQRKAPSMPSCAQYKSTLIVLAIPDCCIRSIIVHIMKST